MYRVKFVIVLFIVVLAAGCESKQAAKSSVQSKKAPNAKIEIIDAEALTVLDTAAKTEIIAEGFNWTEGPLYIAEGDYLLFSDIPENKIYKWKEGQQLTTYLTPSGTATAETKSNEPGSNGLLLHPDGQLVLCQHGDRRMAKMMSPLTNPQPVFSTLTDNYLGKRFNSPNDAVYHSNGDLYFTDPPYGLNGLLTDSAKELDFQGVYRLKPNGQLDVVTKELKYPNGIALSNDGKFLYVASSDAANYIWMQYELDSNGLAKKQQLFYEVHAYEGKNLGAPDGMKVNKQGFMFATGPAGVWVFNSAGKLTARIYTGQITSNCALSADAKTLYMTCDDYVMRLKLK